MLRLPFGILVMFFVLASGFSYATPPPPGVQCEPEEYARYAVPVREGHFFRLYQGLPESFTPIMVRYQSVKPGVITLRICYLEPKDLSVMKYADKEVCREINVSPQMVKSCINHTFPFMSPPQGEYCFRVSPSLDRMEVIIYKIECR